MAENEEDGVSVVGVEDDSLPLDGPVLVEDAPPGVKRGPGRPLEENVSSRKLGVPRFPTPPARRFASEAAAHKNRPNTALNWLNGLPQGFRNRCDFYIYRDLPVLVTPPVDTDTGRPKWYKYIDIVSAADPNPIREEADLLNRYGCGRYRLILNETDKAKGEESRNIFMITITGLGSDYDKYPPNDQLVGDISKVDLDHPDNRGYVQYLRRNGKLPGDLDKEKQEQEMATATIVEKVMDQNKELIDTVVRTSKERPVTPVAAQAGPDVTAVLTMAGEVMREASLNAIKNSNGMTMRDVIELMGQLKPESTSDEVRELRQALDAERRERMTALERQLEKLSTTAANPNTPPTSPFAYFDEGLKAMEHMKTVTDKFTGGGGGAAEEAGMPKFMTWLQPVLTIAQNLASSGVQAWALYQRQQQMNTGVPVPPMSTASPASPIPDTPTTNPTPTAAAVAGLPAPTPGPVAVPDPSLERATTLLNSIQVPLLNYLGNPELDGISFADWFISGFSVDAYYELRQYGQMIEIALTNYEPIKPVIDALPAGRLHQFVDEFLTVDVEKVLSGGYDQDDDDEEEEDEGGVVGVTPITPVA
jgi:hypothetical protein